MSSLGSLVVKLALEMAGYKSGLNEAATETEKAAGRMEKAGARTRDSAAVVKDAMAGNAAAALEVAQAVGVAGAAIGVAAGAAAAVGYAYYQGAQESKAFDRAMIMTGNTAGVTAGQMHVMADGIDRVIGTHAGAVEALAAIASSGKVGRENLQGLTQTALEMERYMGTSVGDTVKVFAELADAPVKASVKLNESLNYLTAATFAQIKAAQEMGDQDAAAALAQEAYSQAMHGRAERLKGNLGVLERAWMGVRDGAKEARDAMLGLGRPDDPSMRLADERALLDRMRAPSAAGRYGQAAIERQEGVVANLQEQNRLLERSSRHQADAAAGEKARIAWMQLGDGYLSNEEKLQQKIAKIESDGAAAGASRLEIERRINIEKERAAGKGKVDHSAEREAEREAALMANLAGVNADYTQQLERLQRMRDKGNVSEAQYVQLVEQLIAKQPMAKVLMEANNKETERQAKAATAAADAYQKFLAGLDKELETLQKDTHKLEEHNERLGLSKVAVAELDAAKLEAQATAQDLIVFKKMELGVDKEQYQVYVQMAEEYRKQAKLRRDGALKEASIDGAKESAKEWQSGWEATNRVAHDSFVMWAEEGGSAGQKIGKMLEKSVLSAIYKLEAEPIMLDIYTAVVSPKPGSGGASGAAAAASGSGSGSGLGWLTNFEGSSTKAIEKVGERLINSNSEWLNNVGKMLLNNSSQIGKFINGAGNLLAAANVIDLWNQGKRGAAVGAGLGQYFGGPIGSFIGQTIGSKFDYTVTPKGNALVANVSGNGASAVASRADFHQSGGWLGGGETDNSSWTDADAGTRGYIDQAVKTVTAANVVYADALGLNADALKGYTAQLEINVTGMDAAAAQAAIDAEVTKFQANQMSAAYGDALKSVALAGETSSQTAERLATNLTGANSVMATLGMKLYDVSVAGAAAASGLVSAMGGLAAFQQQMGAYYQNFYSAEEQRANQVNSAQAEMKAAGITGYTNEQLANADRGQIRVAVEQYAADKDTAEGAKRYAAAVKVANMLAGLTPVEKAAPASMNYAGSTGGGGGGGGSPAQDSGLEDWKRATQAIVDTMTDLRSTLIDTGTDSFERLQAQFAIEIAQAKAGSLQAAQDLPALAKSLKSAGDARHMSSVDRAVLSGQIIEALAGVAGVSTGASTIRVPSFDVGTDRVPYDMLALVHKDERITPAAFNPTLAESQAASGVGSNWTGDPEILSLLQRIDAKMGSLLTVSRDGVLPAVQGTQKSLDTVVTGQRPIRTKAVTA